MTHKPYAANGLDSMPIATLRYYRNFRWHRNTILEGIRCIAIRNMNHFMRTRECLGIEDSGKEEAYKMVCDRMFEDQRMREDNYIRPMVEIIGRFSWEMYLCLLYVELEGYRSASRRDPGLLFGPLEDLFDSKKAAIEHLKTARDKILHPVKGVEIDDAMNGLIDVGSRTDGHYFKLVLDIQRLLDAYCVWLWASLYRLVAMENAGTNRQSCQRRGLEAKLRIAKSALTGPLLRFIGERDDGSLQPPFDLRKWFILGLFKAFNRPQGLKYPGFVQRAKSDCIQMLMRSMVLLNEFVYLMDFQKLRAVKSRAELNTYGLLDFLLVDGSTMTEQQIENLIAPVRVSNALLAEPLRIYSQTVTEMPELRDSVLEDIAGSGSLPPALGQFRNMVFHVSDQPDPAETEHAYLEKMEKGVHTLSLLPRLLGFFISI